MKHPSDAPSPAAETPGEQMTPRCESGWSSTADIGKVCDLPKGHPGPHRLRSPFAAPGEEKGEALGSAMSACPSCGIEGAYCDDERACIATLRAALADREVEISSLRTAIYAEREWRETAEANLAAEREARERAEAERDARPMQYQVDSLCAALEQDMAAKREIEAERDAALARAEEFRASLLLAEQAVEYNQTVVLRAESAREAAEAGAASAEKVWSEFLAANPNSWPARLTTIKTALKTALTLIEHAWDQPPSKGACGPWCNGVHEGSMCEGSYHANEMIEEIRTALKG